MSDFLTQLLIFPFFIVFLRLGAVFMVMPTISDASVPVRARLLLALAVSFALFPALGGVLPAVPGNTAVFITLALGEILAGILIAIGARLFLATMAIAGDILSFMSGFQAATLFDPRLGSISTAPALFLTITGSLLILVTGFHLMMIQAVFESYEVMPVGQLPLLGDVANALVTLIGQIYIIGVKLAAPVTVAGFLTYMAFGLLNRLVPQVQAFFVALPLTLSLGLFIIGLSLGGMLLLFNEELFNHAIILNQPQ